MAVMQEEEKAILQNFCAIIPTLTESEKMYLLGFGEGMRAVKTGHEQTEKAQDTKSK